MNLTAEEQQKVDDLRVAVTPHAANSIELRAFITDSTLVRYLRARNWRLKDATKMLISTLQWRTEYKPHALRWSDVEGEATSGKQFILPARDARGHPVLVLRPRNETTKTHERQLQFLVYHLEAASLMADQHGVGKMMWLVDFVGYSFMTAPPMRISIQTVHILQNHYPERLGVCICYLPPRIFNYTWKAVSPFIDSNTKNRIHFVNSKKDVERMLPPLLDMSQVERCMSGTSDYVYNYEEYSHKMRELDAVQDAKIEAAIKAAKANGSLRSISVNGSAAVF